MDIIIIFGKQFQIIHVEHVINKLIKYLGGCNLFYSVRFGNVLQQK